MTSHSFHGARRVGYRAGALVNGRFRLVHPMEAGGTSMVWRARDEQEGRDVAFKLIHTGLVGTDVETRFMREAAILKDLNHPAKATIYDAGKTEDGFAYIVLELLEGDTLLGLIEREWRIEPTRAVRLLLPVAGALDAAHEQGVIHRDVKPANIVIVKRGSLELPKLIDFGLAKILAAPSRITHNGELVGTLAYASPEQVRGDEVLDARTDVWSLAMVLYHALTGRIAFERTCALESMRAIQFATLVAPVLLGAGDPRLSEVVGRGLEKERERRWPRLRPMGRELANWLLARDIAEDSTGASLQNWLSD